MGKPRALWLRFPLSNFRRCPLSRKTLAIAAACALYLCFVVSRVGYSQLHRGRRIDAEKTQRAHGPERLRGDGAPSQQPAGAVPTRSNVVYITLKSKRLKPVHIRGTVRPKLRRKVRRSQADAPSFTQSRFGAGQTRPDAAPQESWRDSRDLHFKSLQIIQKSPRDGEAGSRVSSIRIYGERAPPWFSAQDVRAMRFLADARASRVTEVSHGGSAPLLIFEGETGVPAGGQRSGVCGGPCGVIHSPVDNSEVFAFHLDRVLGLNRTLPAVSRSFSFLHDGLSCPVVLWDASLYPEGLAAGRATVRLTWREYQSSLKQRCWHRNTVPKADSGCSSIHHYEWSKLAFLDFLLQIHGRLDRSCCGFRPRREDACVGRGQHAQCADQDRIQLEDIVHRGHDRRRLVFVNNKGFFDRNEDNLDFRLLEGIREFPEPAVSVLRAQKLREKLLQSLFLDQAYWESQGGRPGIDKLIDVIERRARVLLTYINAHGIRVVPMNT
ncbi:Golgi-associated kinase 1B [Salarias fasciatus]|uniref:Golgi associated kinase 1B n=1 Tax=Salarias fasciatus TaxID=181472 RepID=A0A672I001_SALFA|nr:Golgi-associated kinase 1B [Salarias fasciatus]